MKINFRAWTKWPLGQTECNPKISARADLLISDLLIARLLHRFRNPIKATWVVCSNHVLSYVIISVLVLLHTSALCFGTLAYVVISASEERW